MRARWTTTMAAALALTLSACQETDERDGLSGDAGAGGAPGMGGQIGAGGEPGAGGNPGDPCAAACSELATCAAGPACAGIDDTTAPGLEAGCNDACDQSPQLADIINSANTCEGVIQAVGQVSPDIQQLCGGGGGGDVETACSAFGSTYARCVTEKCENLADYEDGFATQQAVGCVQFVQSGEVTVAQVQQIAGAPCSALAPGIDPVVGQDPMTGEDGALRAFCTEGPQTDPAVCEGACENVIDCADTMGQEVPPEALAELVGSCVAACVISADLTENFECANDNAGDCAAVNACLDGEDPGMGGAPGMGGMV
ncbi:MAG: hypothetical protein H6704_26710 [Myxococcales bacterium]|nr:hypothetical protein [Myxococcales bacterium]